MKNIEELKSWFEDEKLYVGEYVKHKINQLDEPEVLSKELPVIPKFVADWIEEAKGRHHTLYEAMADYCSPEMNQWIQDFYHSDLFARAWLDGYTVEKEQKYYVLDKEGATLLRKIAAGEGVAQSIGANIYNVKRWENEGKYRLTEQEIKDYDERYFAFAVKVEELEE